MALRAVRSVALTRAVRTHVLYLVDASVYVFRAWYAVPPGMRDADGNPTHALYGFARTLMGLIEARRPAYLAVAFDESHRGGWRDRLYPPYKAQREPAPPELKRQFALCREFCRLLGIAEYASGEFEADDLIGTLARRMRAEGLRVTIVSRDKDLAQLLGPGDRYWDCAADVEYGHADIRERFGARPERLADFLALAGDSVDNVPGVPGVGPKTAAALLDAFESLDALYADLASAASLAVRGAAKLPERLARHREEAFLARTLTRIRCDAPLDADRATLRPRPADVDGLRGFCARAGFGPLLPERIGRLGAAAAAAAAHSDG